MLRLLNSSLVIVAVFCFALHALAGTPLCYVDDGSGYYPDPFKYPVGDACVSTTNMYGARYAHETAPDQQKRQRGGWKIAAEFWNGAADNQKVVFRNNDTKDRFKTSPNDCYGFLFWESCDADLWMGNHIDAEGSWDIKIDGIVVANVEPDMDVPILPVIKKT